MNPDGGWKAGIPQSWRLLRTAYLLLRWPGLSHLHRIIPTVHDLWAVTITAQLGSIVVLCAYDPQPMFLPSGWKGEERLDLIQWKQQQALENGVTPGRG